MNKRKVVTLQDIAQALGISSAAVSKALNGHQGIGEQTKRKVEEMAASLGYDKRRKISRQTSSMDGETTLHVLLVAEHQNLNDPFFASIYLSIDREMKAHGYELNLFTIQSSADYMMRFKLPVIKPHVFVLFGRIPEAIATSFIHSGVPSIAIDHEFQLAPNIDSIGVNDYAGAFHAVRHLYENGHRRIGFIGDNDLSPSFSQRAHGFHDAMRRYGLAVDESYIINLNLRTADGNIRLDPIQQSLHVARLPTAYFCANDPIAFYVSQCLTALGIDIPSQVSIIGFDNLEATQWSNPPLTTIHFPREQIGTVLREILQRRLANPQNITMRILINPHIVVRQSVHKKDTLENPGI